MAGQDGAMSVAALCQGIAYATEGGGVWGVALHDSKEVLLQVDGRNFPLTRAKVSFVDGRFCLVLEA